MPPPAFDRTRPYPRLGPALLLLGIALALRIWDFGNPVIHVDEQYYLLVGDRMLHGAVPYIDIWDRKPIGLFLLFAALRLLPGDGILAYQIAATFAAAATAIIVHHSAALLGARPRGALAAGAVYLIGLSLLGGRGGQSPVFYDLPMVLAAWLTWQTLAGRRRGGIAAMLLVGVALQIKPTVVFEGAFFGVTLVVASWRHHRSYARVARDAAVYVVAALLPTLIAVGAYAAIGQGDAWWFANVQSIFLRRLTPGDPIATRLIGAVVVLLVPFGLAVRGLAMHNGQRRWFLAGWLASAIGGWLLVPPYFNHYALPLLVPLAVAAGIALDRPALRWLAAVAGAVMLYLSGYPHGGETATIRRQLASIAAAFGQDRDHGCPFVFDAPPALYTAAHACLPTRYPFPPHLVEPSEAGAIGVDPRRELMRILAAKPPAIAVGRSDAMIHATLVTDYYPVAQALGITIYRRADLSRGTDRSGASVRYPIPH